MLTRTENDPRLQLSSEARQDPFVRFGAVWSRAQAVDPKGHDAVCVATVGPDGRPSARMVLCKAFDARGFVFYTNRTSRKGRELLANPEVSLCFHWPLLEEQVRVEGRAEPVSEAEADAYFASRPRGSRVGAWASEQSAELPDRETLEARVARYDAQFAGGEVPRPPHWSGFRVVPREIEFWVGLESRLHHRTRYRRTPVGWTQALLSP